MDNSSLSKMLSLRIRLREILDIMPSWTCDGIPKDDRYLNTYEEAVASGDEALSIIRTHSNSDELAQAQEYLSEAMTKLSQIPQKTAIYPQAEAKMSDYDTQSVQIANKLSSSDFQLCADPKPEICRF